MSCIVGNVEFYVGPSKVGAEDNLENVIIDFINGAEKKLEIAVQELENEAIAKSIIEVRKKKIPVKIVIKQDYLKSKKLQKNPWQSK